jgi:hypothetical protein
LTFRRRRARSTGAGDSIVDVFVTKLAADAGGLVYSTYLGGSGGQNGWAIAVDGFGNAYVSGNTASCDFPTTPGAYDRSCNGGDDAFVTKLNASGSALLYSTFLGGPGGDQGKAIAVDGKGKAYIGGLGGRDFPTTPGAFDRTCDTDAFAAKLNASGSALAYSTCLGGWQGDAAAAIAVDGRGSAYVTGSTSSTDFPTTRGAFDRSCAVDAFVTKLNPSGRKLTYSTCLGGSRADPAEAISVDRGGNAYVTGWTKSADFPTTAGAFDRSFEDNGTDDPFSDAFVTKLNASGSVLLYSTFLGGRGTDAGDALALDQSGDAYLTGITYSGDFPTTPDAFQRSCGVDVFVSRLNRSGSALAYSTCLGGASGGEKGTGIAADEASNAYLTGGTGSADFPTTEGAFDRTMGGTGDGFVTKLPT